MADVLTSAASLHISIPFLVLNILFSVRRVIPVPSAGAGEGASAGGWGCFHPPLWISPCLSLLITMVI